MLKKILNNTGVLFTSLALAKESVMCPASSKDNVESKIMALINNEMCSKNCPCPQDAELAYSIMNEHSLNAYDRTLTSE